MFYARHAHVAAIVTFALLVVSAPVARAQSSPEETTARALYAQGDAAYAEGRYEIALSLFEEAYRISRRPQLLYDIANTLERLGRVPEAIQRLREFLPSARAELTATVAHRIEALERRETERLEQARIEAEAAERTRLEEERALAAERDARAVTSTSPPETQPLADAGTGGPPASIPWGPIVLYSLAAVGAGTAVGLGVAAADTSAAAMRDCREVVGTGLLCSADASSTVADAQALGLATDVVWASSAALLAGAVVWTIIDATSSTSSDRLEVSVSPRGFTVEGSF